MRYSKKTLIIGTVATTVGLAAIAGPVLAANIVSHNDQRQEQQEAFEKSLAEKLGVPQADVDRALKEIQGDRLGKRIDELQKDGALTAAQATSIKAQITDGKLPEAMNALMTAMTSKRLAALVAAKTITPDQSTDIASLIEDGVPLGIAGPPPGASQGATPPEGQTRPGSARRADHAAKELAALVEDKRITQEQADQVTALIKAGAPIGIGGPGRRGGDGPGLRHHDRNPDGAGGFGGPPPADGVHGGPPPGNGDGNQPQNFDGLAVDNAPV
jgi:hypothetical protein